MSLNRQFERDATRAVATFVTPEKVDQQRPQLSIIELPRAERMAAVGIVPGPADTQQVAGQSQRKIFGMQPIQSAKDD